MVLHLPALLLSIIENQKNVLSDCLGELWSSFVLFCLIFTGARRASIPLLQSYLLLCPVIRSQRPALGDQQAVGNTACSFDTPAFSGPVLLHTD